MKVIILGDNEQANSTLATKLNSNDYDCYVTSSADEAKDKVETERFPIMLMDINSFNNSSNSIILDIKRADKKISVLILSHDMNDKDSEIFLLNSGADDYMRHPFLHDNISDDNLKLLLARVEARLRFGGTNVIEIDDLIIDPDEEKIFYFNKEIELKGKPFEVLTHLAKNRDQIVSKEQLLDAIWEEPELVTPNVIEVAINQIRQKMDKPLKIGTIETVRRRGYRFCFPNCNKDGNIVDPT